jgi:hypothetical protein
VTLEQRCAARGLTPEQLAARAGVPLTTVTGLVAGTTRAPPVTLRRLGAALSPAPGDLQDELSAARRLRAVGRNRTPPG